MGTGAGSDRARFGTRGIQGRESGVMPQQDRHGACCDVRGLAEDLSQTRPGVHRAARLAALRKESRLVRG